jgi:predicted nucleic acid-binding protein
MKTVIDTNVVLDVLCNRKPFCEDAARIVALSELNVFESYVSASAVTDIYYILSKTHNKDSAIASIKKILKTIKVASVLGDIIYKALDIGWDEFEDSVQYLVGEHLRADFIIARNKKDFVNSSISVVTPSQFLDMLLSNE